MLTNPDKEIELSEEETKKLAIYFKKLSDLQSDIANNTKTLVGTRSECDRAVKDRQYQEELLATVTEQVTALQAKKESLEADVATHTASITEMAAKAHDIEAAHSAKTAELDSREKALKEKEDAYAARLENLVMQAAKLQEDKLAIETAKEAFSKASETVVW